MDESIINFISQYISLSEDEAEIIRRQNAFRVVKKNHILVAQGSMAKECYFILKGCVRAYYLKDGEELNTDFYFENQTVRPVSYQNNQPSAYYLACLEDSILAVGNGARNEELLRKIPKLSSLVFQLNEELLIQKTIEFNDFKNHSPEERYLMLLNSKPELINRIPLYHLASYLGITPISLSRIRSRLVTK